MNSPSLISFVINIFLVSVIIDQKTSNALYAGKLCILFLLYNISLCNYFIYYYSLLKFLNVFISKEVLRFHIIGRLSQIIIIIMITLGKFSQGNTFLIKIEFGKQ